MAAGTAPGFRSASNVSFLNLPLLDVLGFSSPAARASTSDPGGGSTGTAFSANPAGGRLGIFASGLVEALDRDVTTFQDGYDSQIFGVTLGADYRLTDKLLGGAAFTYTNQDGDFENGGNFRINSYGGTLFGSYLPTSTTFVQIVGGYTRSDNDVARAANLALTGPGARAVSGVPSSDANADVFTAGLLVGYDHPVRNVLIGPRLGLNYSNTHLQDYTERGTTGLELTYDDQWVNSFQSVIGVQGSAAIGTKMAVFVPQVNADYIHEFANSQRFINARFAEDGRPTPTTFRFQNERPVRNYFNLGIGVVAVLSQGIQPFANFRAMVGNEQFNNYAGTFGVRLEL